MFVDNLTLVEVESLLKHYKLHNVSLRLDNYQSIYLSISLYMYLSVPVCLSIHMSFIPYFYIDLSICTIPTSLFIYQSIYFFIDLSTLISINLSIYGPFHLSICHLSINLCIYLNLDAKEKFWDVTRKFQYRAFTIYIVQRALSIYISINLFTYLSI